MNDICSLYFSDDGGCKHVVALLLSVANFKKCGDVPEQVQGQASCTDVLCTWNKPRTSNKSKYVIDIERRYVFYKYFID